MANWHSFLVNIQLSFLVVVQSSMLVAIQPSMLVIALYSMLAIIQPSFLTIAQFYFLVIDQSSFLAIIQLSFLLKAQVSFLPILQLSFLTMGQFLIFSLLQQQLFPKLYLYFLKLPLFSTLQLYLCFLKVLAISLLLASCFNLLFRQHSRFPCLHSLIYTLKCIIYINIFIHINLIYFFLTEYNKLINVYIDE